MPRRYQFHERLSIGERRRSAFVALLKRLNEEEQRPTALIRALMIVLKGGIRTRDLNQTSLAFSLSDLTVFLHFIDKLDSEGFLSKTIETGQGVPIATMEPLGPILPAAQWLGHEQVALSPMTSICREGRDWIVSVPLSKARIIVHDEVTLTAIFKIQPEMRIFELRRMLVDDFGKDSSERFLGYLLNSGILRSTGSNISDESEESFWEYHDLLFHSRTREGWNTRPCGATFRHARNGSQPPVRSVVKNLISILPLPAPRSHRLATPFLKVLDARRSRRETGTTLDLQDLSDLLSFGSGLQDSAESLTAEPGDQPRRYPSGGGIYELEIYIVVSACNGLQPGIYRYEQIEHSLSVLGHNVYCSKMLSSARRSGNSSQEPHILIVISGNYRKVSWKYESIAYGLCLKNSAILSHNLTLVAAALNVNCCLLGTGNSLDLELATGISTLSEPALAELAVFGRQQLT